MRFCANKLLFLALLAVAVPGRRTRRSAEKLEGRPTAIGPKSSEFGNGATHVASARRAVTGGKLLKTLPVLALALGTSTGFSAPKRGVSLAPGSRFSSPERAGRRSKPRAAGVVAKASSDADGRLGDEVESDGSPTPMPKDEHDTAHAMQSPDTVAREKMKLSLLKLSAAYDRGYGATPSSRSEFERIVEDLERLNPTDDAARGVLGDTESPLRGRWRMIWTTAQDVLSLASSPIVTVGAIHQVIEPPIATNVIDLIPRPQALLPPQLQPSSILRAEVTTRTSERLDKPNRVGLAFEAVKLTPVELLGVKVPFLPPLAFDLPRASIPGSTPETSPGFFDVTYLDEELLVIQQGAPGGRFALIKVDSYDP